MATTLAGQYIPAPPVLPDNAEEQRRQIGDYIKTAPTVAGLGGAATTAQTNASVLNALGVATPPAAASAQAFVNQTNTNVLTSIQKNNNKASDDNPPVSTTTTPVNANKQSNLNTLDFITPRPNILDNFASNTWTASVYLLSPKQYSQLIMTRKKNVNGYNLLFQSGGAPNNVGGFQGAKAPGYTPTNLNDANQDVAAGIPGNNAPDAGRNPAFPQDFYIESVTFENSIAGKQTQAAHSVRNLKFTVIEPSNITLLDRLYDAVQDMVQVLDAGADVQSINYTAAQYLMVIRWYGYDINGNLVAGKTAPDEYGLSDTKSIVEKFIPFQIRKIDWSVTNKLVNYDFECVPVGDTVALGTSRGTIPYDVQLTAQTVGELLSGVGSYTPINAPGSSPGDSTTVGAGYAGSTGAAGSARVDTQVAPAQSAMNSASEKFVAGAPAKADSAPTTKKTLKSGLAGAMTTFSLQHVFDKHKYLVPDEYEVIFANGAEDIKNATIILPGTIIDQNGVPLGIAASENPTQALNQNAGAMNTTARNWSITAGTQMSQAIEYAIRNSSYIYKQALTTYDAEGNETIRESANNKPVEWYNVTVQAIPLEYDRSRRDYAYKVIYIINKYQIPDFDSRYFPRGTFRGVHKRYPYWFTGENTAVLDFTANFNAAYTMTISGGPDTLSGDQQLRNKVSSNTKDIIKYTYSPASQESSKGAPSKQNEPGANAGEYLYAIDQPGGTTMKIIGDPAWIQQGSLMGGVTAADLEISAFLPDGTINFDSSQVLFEIVWQRPEDYNLSTGLADPYSRPGNQPHTPQQTNVYVANKVVTELRGGKFEQTLTGILYTIPIPETKKAGGTRSSTTSEVVEDDSVNRAEDAKFARQGNRASVTASGSAVVTPQMPTARSAMNQASAVFAGTGTPTAPIFSNPNYSAAAISGTPFNIITPADTIAPASYPQAPTGPGVGPVNVLAGGAGLVGATAANGINGTVGSAGVPSIRSNAPLPLNTTLYNISQKIQNMAKDN